MSRTGATATFWALSDPLRLQILDRVASGAGVTVSELADGLPMTRQAVSRHLVTLEGADLLRGDRHGRERRYRVNTTPIAEANAWLTKRAASWDAALGRLADHLGQGEPDASDGERDAGGGD